MQRCMGFFASPSNCSFSMIRCSVLVVAAMLCNAATAQNAVRLKPSKSQEDSLRNEIKTMLTDDQKYRWMLMFGELDAQKLAELRKLPDAEQFKRMRDVQRNKVGLTQAQKDSVGALQDALDLASFTKLTGIIRSFGFPNGYVEAYEASTILLHTPPARLTSEYFAMLMDEVKAGNLPAKEYAIVYDRSLVEQNHPPLYGEYGTDKPVNIEETNKARAEIGLKKYKDNMR